MRCGDLSTSPTFPLSWQFLHQWHVSPTEFMVPYAWAAHLRRCSTVQATCPCMHHALPDKAVSNMATTSECMHACRVLSHTRSCSGSLQRKLSSAFPTSAVLFLRPKRYRFLPWLSLVNNAASDHAWQRNGEYCSPRCWGAWSTMSLL